MDACGRDTQAVGFVADAPDMTTSEPVEFELTHPSLGYAVPVQLRNASGRWLATAQGLDNRHVGIGATAR